MNQDKVHYYSAMKISPNAPCPCHSGEKYKNCCFPYHRGILPSNALKLMRSRYSAYALDRPEYIIATTHKNNTDYSTETEKWKENIREFTRNTHFSGLKIVEFVDGESIAFVTFEAILNDIPFKEKSRFLNENGKWLYESGEFE